MVLTITGSFLEPYPLVEWVPLEVGGLQVVLQRLGVSVFGGALDETLTHCVDVLQLWLNAVYLLSLHSLRGEGRERKWFVTDCLTDLLHPWIIKKEKKKCRRKERVSTVYLNTQFSSSLQPKIHHILNLHDNNWKWTVPLYVPTYRSGYTG